MDVPRYHTALIVGAGPGLSGSLARLCKKNGMNIALAARRVDKLAELCADTGASAHQCDASDPPRSPACSARSRRGMACPTW